MSVVSGVTIICSCAEDAEPLKAANAWLDSQGVAARFMDVTDAYGGNKHPQITTIGSGLNYLHEDEFAAFMGGLPWTQRENVVLVIQPEEGATRIWRFVGDKWGLL